MKKYITVFFLTSCFLSGLAQSIPQKFEEIDTSKFSKKYYHLKSLFESLPNKKKEIVFLGNSITAQGSWAELFNNKRIINRGISGDRTDGILFRLKEVTESNPSKVFLLIGTNDIKYGRSEQYIVSRIQQILITIKADSPKTKIHLQSILPTYGRKERPIGTIKNINTKLKEIAVQEKILYIDLFPHFISESTGQLDKTFSLDGLHLNGKGYLLWKKLITEFIK